MTNLLENPTETVISIGADGVAVIPPDPHNYIVWLIVGYLLAGCITLILFNVITRLFDINGGDDEHSISFIIIIAWPIVIILSIGWLFFMIIVGLCERISDVLVDMCSGLQFKINQWLDK